MCLFQGLFKHLPQPKKNEIWNSNVDKQEDKLIYNREATIRSKVRKPVKIGVPSLEEFQVDEDEPKAKIAKTLVSRKLKRCEYLFTNASSSPLIVMLVYS